MALVPEPKNTKGAGVGAPWRGCATWKVRLYPGIPPEWGTADTSALRTKKTWLPVHPKLEGASAAVRVSVVLGIETFDATTNGWSAGVDWAEATAGATDEATHARTRSGKRRLGRIPEV